MITNYKKFSLEYEYSFVDEHKNIIDNISNTLVEAKSISIGYTLTIDWRGLILAEMP